MEDNRCPVCTARFRGASTCSRCGADLTAIMRLAAVAWSRREEARRLLAAGDFEQARQSALAAQHAQQTAAGRDLAALIDWLRQAGR